MAMAARGGWSERDWETFLSRADARAARFQELYETLRDVPNRNEIIAREMGWKEALPGCGGLAEDCAECPDRLGCEAYEMLHLMAHPESIPKDPEVVALLEGFRSVERIPAYNAALRFVETLKRLVRRTPTALEDAAVKEALALAQMTPARIAAGHGIGYDRDAVWGNIASCKRAGAHILRCVELLGHAGERGVLPRQSVRALIARAAAVARAIRDRVESLQSRAGGG